MKIRKYSVAEILEMCKVKHAGKYKYNLNTYVNMRTSKIEVKCPKHGSSVQTVASHLKGHGCYKCSKEVMGQIKRNVAMGRYVEVSQPKDYKLIPLSKGKFAKVDNEDFDKLSSVPWFIMGGRGYAINSQRELMHRIVMNCPAGLEVDHKDGDSLNNMKYNLRVCTKVENARYKTTKRGSYKGVYKVYRRVGYVWVAVIVYKGRRSHLGTFRCPTMAALAYDRKAIQLDKDFYSRNLI